MDSKFREYFDGRLKQVFLYLTDECHLRCNYCLYKPNLTFHLKEKEIPLKTAIELISDFRELGASKLTIMGGEPTLYGVSQQWVPLLNLIKESKQMGYEYVRIDTNGMFDSKLLYKEEFKLLDEITFSLDSHKSYVNDVVRGRGSFDKCVSNIRLAVGLGYHVDITACVHKLNAGRDTDGNLLLHKLILFAESLGVNRINFHPIFKMGVPRDTWTNEFDIQPNEWLRIFEEIQHKINNKEYKITVRIPQRFITTEEFNKEPEYYGYCPVKLGERVLVHPDGIIRICALMIGTPYGVARFYNNKIVWDESNTNETINHKLDESTKCANQRRDFGKYIPLCISFKPKQEEIIWKKRLKWEKKRKQL